MMKRIYAGVTSVRVRISSVDSIPVVLRTGLVVLLQCVACMKCCAFRETALHSALFVVMY